MIGSENVQDTQDQYHELMHHNPHVRVMVQNGYSERAIILHLCNIMELQNKRLIEAEIRRPPPPIHMTVTAEQMEEIKRRFANDTQSKEEETKPTDS